MPSAGLFSVTVFSALTAADGINVLFTAAAVSLIWAMELGLATGAPIAGSLGSFFVGFYDQQKY